MSCPRLIATSLVATVTGLLSVSPAAAFPMQDDQTPGSMAANYRQQNNFWARFDAGFMDAKVTSSPGTTKLDRRLENLTIVGFDQKLGRWGVRGNVKAEYSKQRESEDEAPRAVVDQTIVTYSPSVDATFVTDKGLEIFGGAVVQMQPAYKKTSDAGDVNSETSFDATRLIVRRFGVLRSAGAWSGGFYYVMGAETTRGYEQSASDGSAPLSDSDVIFVPSRVGVFGAFEAAATLWDFELDFVQARGMGPKDDTGATIYTDYFEARLGGLYFLSGALGMKGSVAHKTLSYANNAYVTLETIPVTSLKLLGVLGKEESHAYAGIILATGKDGQSLPEFNATYEMTGVAVTLGCQISL